jgi:simple sugar transport system ATP-binding protein
MIELTLNKTYPGTVVLTGAEVTIERGTVHALCGENGAGKSTLVKILAGIVPADAGSSLRIDGKDIDLAQWTRRSARAAGIGIVQQHGASAGTLTVVENAVLGVEPMAGPLLDLDATASALRALGDKVGLPIDPGARTDELALGAAQRAEIVTALHHGAKVLILDEPTAVLAPVEVDGLLAMLRRLAAEGTTIIIVTHKLDEVKNVADEVTVLRAGKSVARFESAADTAAIARAMVGSELPAPTSLAAPSDDAPVVLALDKLGVPGALRDVSLEVRAGELVGVAGVDGNGQRELALAIAGLVSHSGTVRIGERAYRTRSTRAGLAHIPEDRHHGGLVLDASIAENLVLGRTDVTGRFVIDRDRVATFADERIRELDIRPPRAAMLARSLSGGNQQKIVIARELSRPQLKAVLAVQPTRGVDLGAVARIHDRLRAAAAAGAGCLVISADLDELLALCHRIVVLLRGQIVGTGMDRTALGALMTGASA